MSKNQPVPYYRNCLYLRSHLGRLLLQGLEHLLGPERPLVLEHPLAPEHLLVIEHPLAPGTLDLLGGQEALVLMRDLPNE